MICLIESDGIYKFQNFLFNKYRARFGLVKVKCKILCKTEICIKTIWYMQRFCVYTYIDL